MKYSQKLVSAVAIGTVMAGGAAVASEFEWKARPIVGSKEVPPVVSEAEARAEFAFEDGMIKFRLRMREPITNATMAHIHLANSPTANGPVVLWLLGNGEAPLASPTNFAAGQTVARGTVTLDKFRGPLAGKSAAEIVAALDSGNAYVNMHTVSNPRGEIRGAVEVD